MTKYENIEIELTEPELCSLINLYVHQNFDGASISVFNQETDGIGLDLESYCSAAGKALLNESMIDAIKRVIDREEQVSGSEEEPTP